VGDESIGLFSNLGKTTQEERVNVTITQCIFVISAVRKQHGLQTAKIKQL
jgi:hypothetical protein